MNRRRKLLDPEPGPRSDTWRLDISEETWLAGYPLEDHSAVLEGVHRTEQIARDAGDVALVKLLQVARWDLHRLYETDTGRNRHEDDVPAEVVAEARRALAQGESFNSVARRMKSRVKRTTLQRRLKKKT